MGHVLRPLRLPQAHPSGRQRFSFPFLHSWLDRYCHCWPHVIPHRHCAEAYDDDLRTGCQVQGLHGLLRPGPEERGLHVTDEGSWSQHPPWCGWCWCPSWFRQVQGGLRRMEVGLSHPRHFYCNISTTTTKQQTNVTVRKIAEELRMCERRMAEFRLQLIANLTLNTFDLGNLSSSYSVPHIQSIDTPLYIRSQRFFLPRNYHPNALKPTHSLNHFESIS